MNIEQYRAIKAEEKAQKKVEKENPIQPTPAEPVKPVEEEIKPEPTKAESTPDKILIDGEEVNLSDVKEWKNGYLRNSDYTKKTQEIASTRREYESAKLELEELKRNQPIIENNNQQSNLGIPKFLQAPQKKIQELEARIQELSIQQEVRDLQSKYSDFDAREVMQLAYDERINSLENAYHIHKSRKPKQEDNKQPTIDMEQIKKEIREQLLKELEDERTSTRTSISTRDSSTRNITSDEPILTMQEKKTAKAFKMTDAEYYKYKNTMRGK